MKRKVLAGILAAAMMASLLTRGGFRKTQRSGGPQAYKEHENFIDMGGRQ